MFAVHLISIWLCSRELLRPRATLHAILQWIESSPPINSALRLFGLGDFRDLRPMFIAAGE
jgi:hypothetical protein